MIGLIDYGMGNLRSVQKALEQVGAQVTIVTHASVLKNVDKVVLPGVGAIKPAMDRLEDLGLASGIKEYLMQKKPFLGICLGFQLLFETSTEGGLVKGLGVLPGSVERFPSEVKAPQMGWNSIKIMQKQSPMFNHVLDNSFVYFCHSYYVKPSNTSDVATLTHYGFDYASSICKDHIWGVQFHPEKSQTIGLSLLRNFVAL